MIKVTFDFYKEYDSKLLNNKLKRRINYMSLRHFDSKPHPNFLEDSFVDIFSRSVLPNNLLKDIEKVMLENDIKSIYDLSCGSGFHIFFFTPFTNIKGYAIEFRIMAKVGLM